MTVSEKIKEKFSTLTRAERQLANVMLDNYPASSLGTVVSIAEAAKVSNPTVVRLAKKLDFMGFSDMQRSLHEEIGDTLKNPIEKHASISNSDPSSHLLGRFSHAVINNIQQTVAQIDEELFNQVVDTLINPNSSLYIVGGRISHSIAEYMFTHMQVIRANVTMVEPNANRWSHYVINMNPGDTLVVFDIRRYENDILTLAEIAQSRDVRLVLFTDQWGSPVSKFSQHVFHARIEAPSAWDSNVAITFLVEALVEAVQSATWSDTSSRMKDLEVLLDRVKLFKKFV
ncbi:MurR/RpiR family transcriptional regulator [Vibrio sp. Isolate31]|uniref:MurR/RpiR family transcriptional regulator n=1 Tax=unclassified Vibrio TaxID=2614977 RepID=UPI001EFCF9F3|nr:MULTISPECIES: MurR/RpiR family transcriptional regulator [unclassified Vibrio]MCG9552896.1 MurR/RpiR family transcriptional regulator [Vibrio sp. Isolate32]MCG9600199.1 MurR/RpiR family transcriptional regulator [Vibrio sp. Isolate31]